MSINSQYRERGMATVASEGLSRQEEEEGESSSYTDEEMEEADTQRLLSRERREPVSSQYATPAPATPAGVYPQLPHFVSAPPAAALVAGQVTHNTQYGSVSSSAPSSRSKPRGKRYRLAFLILLVFNFGLIIFLSIICYDAKSDFAKVPGINYFTLKLNGYYFDLVLIGAVRFLLNSLLYLLMAWVTRLVMAATTLVPTLYVPLKAYFCWPLHGDNDGDFQDISILVILFIAFVMPWAETFFFEFKYLPAELARLRSTSWGDWRFWCWPRALVEEDNEDTPSLPDMAAQRPQRPALLPPPRPAAYAASTISLDFRTPMGSTRTSPIPPVDYFGTAPDEDLPPITEETSPSHSASPITRHSTLSAEDLRYKTEGENALQKLMEFTRSNDGWKYERTANGIIFHSSSWQGKKIWKAEHEMELSALQLWNILFPGEHFTEWNPRCTLNQTLYRVDEELDIVYSVTASTGPVSSRDFVSVRQVAIDNGCYFSASCATTCDLKPPQSGKVRGENGPCGYKVVPIGDNRTLFIWVLNCDLKGWLPQSVIDQTLCGVMTGTFEKLQEFIDRRKAEGRL